MTEQTNQPEHNSKAKQTSQAKKTSQAEQTNQAEHKTSQKKGRVFNIMQYEIHPDTKEVLLDENRIVQVLEKYVSIKEWAWIVHDKDTNADGTQKPKHFHIVFKTDNAILVSDVAKWFGIGENFVDVPKGRGAFFHCVKYLTHENPKEQEKGKYRYDDNEVKANFNFRDFLVANATVNDKKLANMIVDDWIVKIANGEKTMKECRRENLFAYLIGLKRLESAEKDYVNNKEIPQVRLNYYIYGSGGSGKNLLSRSLARTLFPNMADDEIFFEVGAEKSAFDGYAGQPVLIWNDARVSNLLRMLGGRGELFDIFDTTPTSKKQNVKYGSVRLLNTVNIVNSVVDYVEFLNGLAGNYIDANGVSHGNEDVNQSYRRFPVILPIREEEISIMINMGFVHGDSKLYRQYYELDGIKVNLVDFIKKYGLKRLNENSGRMLKQLNKLHVDLLTKRTSNVDELPEDVEQQIKKLEETEIDLNSLKQKKHGRIIDVVDVVDVIDVDVIDDIPIDVDVKS